MNGVSPRQQSRQHSYQHHSHINSLNRNLRPRGTEEELVPMINATNFDDEESEGNLLTDSGFWVFPNTRFKGLASRLDCFSFFLFYFYVEQMSFVGLTKPTNVPNWQSTTLAELVT